MQIFFPFDEFFTMTFKILEFTITWKIRLSLYDSSNTMPLKFDGIFFGKKLFFSQFVNVNKLKVGLPQKHDDRLCFTPFTFPERIRILNFLLLHDY